MTHNAKIDTRDLLRRARSSESKEAFTTVRKGRGYRIGVGARTQQENNAVFFLEVVIDLSQGKEDLDLSVIENKVAAMRRLEARGYSLVFQGDSGICCEAEFPAKNLNEECKVVWSILEKAL